MKWLYYKRLSETITKDKFQYCQEIRRFFLSPLNELRHEKNLLSAYAKSKAQIRCAVIAQLINTFVFAA